MESLKRKDIERVFEFGTVKKFPFFTVIFLKNNNQGLRVTFIASRKFSKKAVERNRAKRIIREALRKIVNSNPQFQNLNYDLIFIARPYIKKKKALI
jgi:ribonuclease P protein component